MIARLATTTVGWVKFHPTKANITRVENEIAKILENNV